MYNHQLDTFVKVAESGSFSKAAAGLFISSTAAIQQINLLEERCGFKLFVRSSHGVKLTAAGKSLYDDVKTLIKLSNDSLAKASRLAETSETTVRIATTLLYKCRLLPNIWTKINEQYPELKIEILPMTSNQEQNTTFSLLGNKYDMFEGIYGTKGWKGKCNFLELTRTPICCAVAKNHRLAKEKSLSLKDLNGEYAVMPIEGVSYELDTLRAEINKNYPTIGIIDSSYYGLDTFTLCEVNPYILITQKVYSDIHTNLVTIPLKPEQTMPYGIIYSKNPTPATRKFIAATQNIISMQ